MLIQRFSSLLFVLSLAHEFKVQHRVSARSTQQEQKYTRQCNEKGEASVGSKVEKNNGDS